MVPASLTATATLAGGSTVVNEFSGLILLVGAFVVGIWGVRYIPKAIRKAVRG